MRLIISLILLANMGSVVAETVYKTVDENGNIIFTDKPSKNAEEIKLQKLQTIKNPNPAKHTPSPKQAKDKGPIYKKFLIANPENESGLRSNNGDVTISVTLEPPLRGGHRIIITLDGEEVSNGPVTSVSLQDVDRGTHSISASVVDGKAKNMISTSSNFTLLRQPAPRKTPR